MHFRCGSVKLSCRSLEEKYIILNLSSRHLQLDAMMFYDLYHNRYDCAGLIGMLCYHVPCREPNKEAGLHQSFHINRCRTVAGTLIQIHYLMATYNTHFYAIDIIASTVESFRKNIFKTLNRAFDV
ncbi:hypothetical protein EVAR_25990_1 [Eumeta japonica]|uniref:Uncharacterized protein n=1 Tax=Eumeta variegata TaxID=151549 RepID=A0A4C1V292_EUMVA|nr:hypothetical protein EVAR_25990_1 [Eumeta japonica]